MIDIKVLVTARDFFDGLVELHRESPAVAWFNLAWLALLSIGGIVLLCVLCFKMRSMKEDVARKVPK